MKNIITITLMLFLTGCVNSSYNYSYSSSGKDYRPKHKQEIKSRVKRISIDFVSSSDFWKIWQKDYFRDTLGNEIEMLSDIRVVRRGADYSIKVDLYDRSSSPRRKMGNFLGQKQYRIIQEYDVSAWYRIKKRGNVVNQDRVNYVTYYDAATNRSYRDTEKKVIRHKIEGIAKRVAVEVVEYFRR